ncbi:MAG: glycosyltransferase [Proteobacteria bacterium]|nr:glycosyltransferase [Pseudomonadota bacterium]MDA1311327.1 glycosyltransferase [Pseudomonadota bacterium]
MRIVHLIGTLAERDGGPSRVCVDMARAVAARGHEVSIHSTDIGMTPEALEGGNTVVIDGVDIHYHPAWPGGFWRFSPALWRAMDAAVATADIVHMHSLYLFHNWAGWRACRRHGTPFLLRPHGSMDPYIWRRHRGRKTAIEWLFMNRVLRDAAALHFTTSQECLLARPYTQGAPGVVVPNGVRLDEFGAAAPDGRFRALFGGDDAIRLVLFLGRLNFKKGLDLLAPAFAALAARDPRARLLIAGPDDGMEQPTRAQLAGLGLLDKVRFTGLLRGEETRAALADADLFVLPSYSENFGNAVVESMASGTPVLISDQVNIWRDVSAAGAGRVVPCDVGRLADAMTEMLADPAELAAAGHAGREVAERYGWQKVAEKLERVYIDLASGLGPMGAAVEATAKP